MVACLRGLGTLTLKNVALYEVLDVDSQKCCVLPGFGDLESRTCCVLLGFGNLDSNMWCVLRGFGASTLKHGVFYEVLTLKHDMVCEVLGTSSLENVVFY